MAAEDTTVAEETTTEALAGEVGAATAATTTAGEEEPPTPTRAETEEVSEVTTALEVEITKKGFQVNNTLARVFTLANSKSRACGASGTITINLIRCARGMDKHRPRCQEAWLLCFQ